MSIAMGNRGKRKIACNQNRMHLGASTKSNIETSAMDLVQESQQRKKRKKRKKTDKDWVWELNLQGVRGKIDNTRAEISAKNLIGAR